MKLLLTIIAVVLLATTAFADPIHDTAANGDLAGVQAELDKGVDVNAKDDDGMTPLHEAALKGHKEIAELLIAKGADVNAKDGDGMTPLFNSFLNAGSIELLIENGANPNLVYTDPYDATPYTVFDWYEDLVWVAPGQETKDEIKDNANLIRKLGGKKYFELNPPEIIIRRGWGEEVYVHVYGTEGSTFDILHSSNLNNWKVLKTVTIDIRRGGAFKPEIIFGSSFYKIRPID